MSMTIAEYDRLVRMVADVFATARQLFADDPKWQGKENAHFCAAERTTGRMYFPPTLIGEPMKDDPAKRIYVVQEKLGRLARHPKHCSSRQSRNPSALPWGEWGGAIALPFCPELELPSMGLTGLPELGDEAVLLEAAREFLKDLLFKRAEGGRPIKFLENPGGSGLSLYLAHLYNIADYPDPEPNKYFYALWEERRLM
ncbi:MAG: hypothetical protein HY434_01020 [Candidatus Liptonbacteria bacterium]|nr:hypothetical protein [Candidatus Liptonbacteria bacterium]